MRRFPVAIPTVLLSLVLNTALMTASSNVGFAAARIDRELWGRLVETAVGAHIVNGSMGTATDVFYWRDRGREVDFVVRRGKKLTAIEVKSGLRRDALAGLEVFGQRYRGAKKLLVGGDGIPVEEFLLTPVDRWI